MQEKGIKNNHLYNILWYMFGLLSYGFTSLLYMIIITRILGVESAGMFSFAFAIAATFYVVGVYFGSAFQITDTSKKYSDTDYLHNRITTCILMIILTLIFCLFNKYEFDKILLIMFLTVYRGVDALLDSIHAVTQKRDKIYKIGMLTFFRTVILILSFLLAALISKNLLISVITIMIVDIVYAYVFDYKVAKKKIISSKFNNYKNIVLLIEGFSVFIFSFLAIYILNLPKYTIDVVINNEVQGLFGIIFMPSSFMSLICLYLVHPFLNKISSLLENKEHNNLSKFIVKMSLFIIVLGLFITFVGYLLGIPVLEFLYNLDLKAYRLDLVIVLLGTIFISLYTLYSNVLIAMRKILFQVITLIITAIFGIFISNYLITNYGLSGACYSYFFIMLFQLIIYIFGIIYYINRFKVNKKKKVAIRLMGGLGNQMFQYAQLRYISLKNNATGIIDLKGITNKNHNVYGLNHCNISKDIIIDNNFHSLKGFIDYILYGLSWVIFKNKKIYKDIQPILNSYGIYCVPDGYIKLNEFTCDNNYMVGYFASNEYIKEYDEIIKEELQIKDELKGKNKEIFDEISNSNSVCIHIRRGDYIGSFFEVCTPNYYYSAIKEMKKRVKNAKFYVFSDDINWVKENMKFDNDVILINWENNQYEDLKLMSSCKNFIMSNSTYSFFAQYLSKNNDKTVIAPSKWYNNSNEKGIYDDSWILVDVMGDNDDKKREN